MEDVKIGNIFRTREVAVLFHVNAPLIKSVYHFYFYRKNIFIPQYSTLNAVSRILIVLCREKD